jgi:hypothetical protein
LRAYLSGYAQALKNRPFRRYYIDAFAVADGWDIRDRMDGGDVEPNSRKWGEGGAARREGEGQNFNYWPSRTTGLLSVPMPVDLDLDRVAVLDVLWRAFGAQPHAGDAAYGRRCPIPAICRTLTRRARHRRS